MLTPPPTLANKPSAYANLHHHSRNFGSVSQDRGRIRRRVFWKQTVPGKLFRHTADAPTVRREPDPSVTRMSPSRSEKNLCSWGVKFISLTSLKSSAPSMTLAERRYGTM